MFDGGPGGARGAPPAIDQVTAEVKASSATLSSTRTRTRWSQRGPVPTVWNHLIPPGAAGFIAEVLPVFRQSGAAPTQFFS